MNQEERYEVLQALLTISDQESYSYNLEELHKQIIVYDFFEDLFDILHDFHYDKHLVFLRVSSLFDQFDPVRI